MIKSFVLRQGRMTKGQFAALSRLSDRYICALPGCDAATQVGAKKLPILQPMQGTGVVDWDSVFQRRSERVLEIGFGDGQSLIAQCLSFPDIDFIGVEVHLPGVARLMLQADQENIENLKILRIDIGSILTNLFTQQNLNKVCLFFPDPWHKRKYHKRRLIQPEFVELVCQVLKPGGVFHIATDWQDYARHIQLVMSAHQKFQRITNLSELEPRPTSAYEQRAIKLAMQILDLQYRKLRD